MTFQEFINHWLGKMADWDKKYFGQCVDLFRFYCNQVLKIPQPKPVRGASDFWTKFSSDPILVANFYPINYTSDGIPQFGDVILWNKNVGEGFGHVSIFIEGDANSFTSLDQNWPTLSKVTKTKHDYKNVYGWLRPKGKTMADPDIAKQLEMCKEEQRKNDDRIEDARNERDEAKNRVLELEVKYQQLEKQLADTERGCQKQLEVLNGAKSAFLERVTFYAQKPITDFEEAITAIGQISAEVKRLDALKVENQPTQVLFQELLNRFLRRLK